MTWRIVRKFGLGLTLLGAMGATICQTSNGQQSQVPPPQLRGKDIFETRCGICHGLDGLGGEHAPDIIRRTAVRSLPDQALFGLIHDGIPQSGMPAFTDLGKEDIHAVVAYLRFLQRDPQADSPANSSPASSKADPIHGQEVFFGKAGCSSCHQTTGQGSFFAEDLNIFARDHSADEIREAILRPVGGQQDYATAAARDGRTFPGIIRNEDNASLQLQDKDGRLYLLMKSTLVSVQRKAADSMPVDYGQRLSALELDDLIAYLQRDAGASTDPHLHPERMRSLMIRIELPSHHVKLIPFLMLLALGLQAQEHPTDPTWLHRYVPELSETQGALTSPTCHYRAVFGEGDKDNRSLQTVARFGEVTLDAHGDCRTTVYDRQEEIYFVVEGAATLHYEDQARAMRRHDFTYLPPGAKHSLSNNSDQKLRVLVMGFNIPSTVSIPAPPPHPQVANLEDAKEETVSGHPNSVLYKLLIGLRTGKRDQIEQAYVMDSFFWMDFTPGGTNWPHHHEAAEEIYLVIDGQGDIVAGGGSDGVEGRHPAKPGDAYYFRPNCTVGFYNQNKPGAKAYILAVRARVPLHEDEE